MVCDLKLKVPKLAKTKFFPKLCLWKLNDPTVRHDFERVMCRELDVMWMRKVYIACGKTTETD